MAGGNYLFFNADEVNTASGNAELLTIDDQMPASRVGPILYFRNCDGDRLELAALLVCPVNESTPIVTVANLQSDAEALLRRDSYTVLRYVFSLPVASGGIYSVDDESFEVAGMREEDLRLAYVSCNGQEHGDQDRQLSERNQMWQRLAEQHRQRPFNVLLQGGDQLYADEALDVHPAVRAWADGDVSDQDHQPLSATVREKLCDFWFERYLRLYNQPALAWLHARVPSLCMWDDHDICDGWGSHSEERIDSPIGRHVFQTAREHFLLFQLGCVDDDLPPICCDSQGTSLTWAAKLPGLLIVAPDLRSERRPNRIMGSAGWQTLERIVAAADSRPVFVLSSVPLLGPRLSWVEAILHLLPGMQKYEDDLRDQWQSQAHREEWRRILRTLLNLHEAGTAVTVLSGEIHLATRATMSTGRGPLHQLIASGIAHPPPNPWYGRILGLLARLGEAPLPEHPIRLHPLPGQRSIYTSQRNYLLLERRSGHWTAVWELEGDGPTAPLPL